MPMKPGSFRLNGIDSWTENGQLKVLIQDRPDIEVPKRKITTLAPPGVDSILVFDERAYESTKLKLDLLIEGYNEADLNRNRIEVSKFFVQGKWLDFEPYWDEDKVYRVLVHNPPVFTNKYWMEGYMIADVELLVKPYKYYKNVHDFVFSHSGKIINPYHELSKPLIRIEGSGNFTLYVNDIPYEFKNVDTPVNVDSEIMEIHGDAQMHEGWTRPYYPNLNYYGNFAWWPKLEPGENTIRWEGNVRQVRVKPRWRSLV